MLSEKVKYFKGDTIISKGDSLEHIYFVINGSLKVIIEKRSLILPRREELIVVEILKIVIFMQASKASARAGFSKR